MIVLNKIYNRLVIILILVITSSFSVSQDYVKIGNQIWTNKNLAVNKFRNGETINESKNKEDWYKASYKGEPTWCYYMFDEKNSHLGKLYNYYAVSSPKNIAPIGWKVPTYFDYFELIKFLDPLISHTYLNGNGSLAGGSLKIKNSQYWKEKNCKQIDSKFNAIPAGGYSPSLNYPKYDWDEYGEVAGFWCITDWQRVFDVAIEKTVEKDRLLEKLKAGGFDEKAIVVRLSNNDCVIGMDDDPKIYGYSLRLIKNDK
ncbi:fibrobacter succinogenes major paralogous domain-containing protein [Salibacteraceae bacterium]|nr:fibrobacter succinogenes major paralogous domain-containing protein [Salibacteraceae bacterium]MDB9709992.1 fibrobacter succinogenes major paralogous domain-containing protein [Salibacteraceae bacterium]